MNDSVSLTAYNHVLIILMAEPFLTRCLQAKSTYDPCKLEHFNYVISGSVSAVQEGWQIHSL